MYLSPTFGVALGLLVLGIVQAEGQAAPNQPIGTRPANDNADVAASTAYVDGALRATAQRVFRVDPRLFGATCNGSGTGDDAGLTEAINALTAAKGGTLLIPGKCVIGTAKVVAGVPISVVGDGSAVSQLVGSAAFGSGFLLTLDISAGSDLTVDVTKVGFRTLQAEGASALRVVAAVSGLEHRFSLDDVEMRGGVLAAHGFVTGLELANVGAPRVTRLTVTGRQSGNGPTGLTHMSACISIVNTAPGLSNYAFSDVRCNAAQRGWSINGYIEGVFCTRCIAVAVATGWHVRPGALVPLLNISQSHADFFNIGVDAQQLAQGSFMGNLFYHRSDSTEPGVCYHFASGASQNQIIGGECVNLAPVTSLVGVIWDNSSNNIVSDVVFSALNFGVTNTNGSAGNVYRRGQWMNVPSGASEHGNDGSPTNVCIGYNAAC